jgi:hypothetical protein
MLKHGGIKFSLFLDNSLILLKILVFLVECQLYPDRKSKHLLVGQRQY